MSSGVLDALKKPAATLAPRPAASRQLSAAGGQLENSTPQAGEAVHDFGNLSLAAKTQTPSCPLATPRTCPFGGACHTCPTVVQAKLEVGQPDDEYEREADRVADEVTRMPEPRKQLAVSSHPSAISGQHSSFIAPRLSLSAAPAGTAGIEVSPAVEAQIQGLRASGGRPLSESERSFFEPRFEHNFGGVRIHQGPGAAEAAQAVSARAFTVGQDVVFGSNPGRSEPAVGNALLAHELTHVVQQAGSLTSRAKGAESASLRAAVSGAARPVGIETIQRMVFVRPAAAATDILADFNTICPGKFSTIASSTTAQIIADCKAGDRSKNRGCGCFCDVAHDTKRKYWIDVKPATRTNSKVTLHDKTKATIPTSSVYPNTQVGDNPAITMPAAKGSSIEFGAFGADGTSPIWCSSWRILAHELCGHARLRQKCEARGCRRRHNSTIKTENAIAAEHGGAERGRFADRPRQGESFYNPVGDRSKVVFKLCDGEHYEAP